jgi:hypothetical protein
VDRVNAEYADEHALRAWAAEEITWGIFNVPETRVGVLGDVSGLERNWCDRNVTWPAWTP